MPDTKTVKMQYQFLLHNNVVSCLCSIPSLFKQKVEADMGNGGKCKHRTSPPYDLVIIFPLILRIVYQTVKIGKSFHNSIIGNVFAVIENFYLIYWTKLSKLTFNIRKQLQIMRLWFVRQTLQLYRLQNLYIHIFELQYSITDNFGWDFHVIFVSLKYLRS